MKADSANALALVGQQTAEQIQKLEADLKVKAALFLLAKMPPFLHSVNKQGSRYYAKDGRHARRQVGGAMRSARNSALRG